MSHIEELEKELQEEKNVLDEATDSNEKEAITRYDITSYGIDFDIEGLVKRIDRGDIYIPSFQRNFVWKLTESSRLVESILLGLPVPGVFLAQEPESGKMLVIDGQQRLLSLAYFFKGVFNPIEGETRQRVFRLAKVQPQFEGKTFEQLDSRDRINLENSVIHATVVKQDAPADDDTSIYHIFERLNTGGRKLSPQEIRTAVYHGSFVEVLSALNKHDSWRSIYGRENERMKDQELIVRYFAMLEGYTTYEAPMKEFLNKFVQKYRNYSAEQLEGMIGSFKLCCDLFFRALGAKAFRPTAAINVAFFEATMIGLTNYIEKNETPDISFVKQKYDELIGNEEFMESISQSTGNKSSVFKRIEFANDVFMGE